MELNELDIWRFHRLAEDERQHGDMIFKVHYTDGTIFLELFDRFAPEPICPLAHLSKVMYAAGISLGADYMNRYRLGAHDSDDRSFLSRIY